MRIRTTIVATGAAALAAALVLPTLMTACGSSEAELRDPSRADGLPVKGGTFHMVIEAPKALDPATVDSVYDALPI